MEQRAPRTAEELRLCAGRLASAGRALARPQRFASAAHARFVGQPALQLAVITETPVASTQVNCGVCGALGAIPSAPGRDRVVQGRGMPLPNKRVQLAGAAK